MLGAFASFISKSPVIQSRKTYIYFLHHLPTMAEISLQEFHLREEHGDLFSCPENEALAHCVSKDFAMGKGIAVQFKKKFGGVAELKRQGKGVGDVATLKRDHQYIYYLITKERYFQKPTYASLRLSLSAMKKHCLENGVKRISMPKIGCGLDKLEWDKVRKEIVDLFKDSPITVTVYSL